MNIDELRQAMKHDITEVTVPLTVAQIKTSHSSLKHLKKWIYSDLIACLVMVCTLVVLFFLVGDHPLGHVLYMYTATISILAFLGFISLQIRLLRRLNLMFDNSRKTIEHYLVQIKSYFEVSKFITTGLATSFFVPIIIYDACQNKNQQYITDFLTLNLPTSEVVSILVWLMFLVALVFFGGSWMYKKYPEKRIKELQHTLDHFND
jgi:hypothetical protein